MLAWNFEYPKILDYIIYVNGIIANFVQNVSQIGYTL
jgi:hypothetical protein